MRERELGIFKIIGNENREHIIVSKHFNIMFEGPLHIGDGETNKIENATWWT